MYGGGASVGAYSRLYSGMYDDDTFDDDRASSSLVGGAESLHCDCVSCDSITPLETIIILKLQMLPSWRTTLTTENSTTLLYS